MRRRRERAGRVRLQCNWQGRWQSWIADVSLGRCARFMRDDFPFLILAPDDLSKLFRAGSDGISALPNHLILNGRQHENFVHGTIQHGDNRAGRSLLRKEPNHEPASKFAKPLSTTVGTPG